MASSALSRMEVGSARPGALAVLLEARRTLDQAFGYRGSLQQPANISAQPVKLNAMR